MNKNIEEINQMRVFLRAAKADEIAQVATLAGTTVGTLNQIAGSYRTEGNPQVRSGLAGRIQSAVAEVRRTNKALPTVLKTDLSPECRECEYARKCLRGSELAGEFNVLAEKN